MISFNGFHKAEYFAQSLENRIYFVLFRVTTEKIVSFSINFFHREFLREPNQNIKQFGPPLLLLKMFYL